MVWACFQSDFLLGGVRLVARAVDLRVDPVVVGEVRVRILAGHHDRIRMEELGQIRIRRRSKGHVHDQRIDVLADLVVHGRVVDDLHIHLDADPGQLGLHRLVDHSVRAASRTSRR